MKKHSYYADEDESREMKPHPFVTVTVSFMAVVGFLWFLFASFHWLVGALVLCGIASVIFYRLSEAVADYICPRCGHEKHTKSGSDRVCLKCWTVYG